MISPNFSSGYEPTEAASGSKIKYTVPVVFHVPTKSYKMDSIHIAHFLESTYPERPIQLSSDLGYEIEDKARTSVGLAFCASVMPYEMRVLSPRAAQYFRVTREAALGHPIEDCSTARRRSEPGRRQTMAWVQSVSFWKAIRLMGLLC